MFAPVTQRSTVVVTALSGLLVSFLARRNVAMPVDVALAIVGLAAVGTSAVFPRWAEGRVLWRHPAGVAAILTTVLTWVAATFDPFGLQITAEEAGWIVVVVVAAVGIPTPRESAESF